MAKRKLTTKQLANLAKGRAALKKKRAKKKRTVKKRAPGRLSRASRAKKKRATKKRVATASGATHPKARAALRSGRNPVKPSSRVSPHYAIKQGGRFYDGAGFTKNKRQAAMWMDLKRCKNIAQKVADATGKQCEIVH